MKKNSILLVMFISLFFIFDRTVFAEEKYSCSYNVQYADGGYFNIKAIANKDGSYDVQYQTDSKTWQSTSSYKLGGVMYYKRGDTYVSEGTMMFTLSNLSSKNFEKAITSSKLTTDCPVINVQFDNSSMYYFFFADSKSLFISSPLKSYFLSQNWQQTSVFSSFESSSSDFAPVEINAASTLSREQLHLYSGFEVSRISSSNSLRTFWQMSSGLSPSQSIDVTEGISFMQRSTASIVSSIAVGRS